VATTIEETAVTAETDRFRRRVEADRGDETTSFRRERKCVTEIGKRFFFV
jgi:hypothetical protein